MNGFQRTISIALVIGAYACAQSTKCEQGTATCAEPAAKVVSVGEDFVLAPGQRATIGASGISVTFEDVRSDSRCPKDVQCIWAGDATIRLRVVEQAGQPQLVELNTQGDRRKAQLGRFDLEFVALAPEPVSTVAIDARQYRVTVRLIERP